MEHEPRQSFSYHIINLVSAQETPLHLFLRTIEEQDKLWFDLSLQESSSKAGSVNKQLFFCKRKTQRSSMLLTTFSNAARFSSLRGKPSMRNLSFPFS